MSLSVKCEALVRIYYRYQRADRLHKKIILDEFCADCGYHRKAACELSAEVLALRHSQLRAGRLALEQQRLVIEPSRVQTVKDQEFWEWSKRPDIQE